MVGTVDGIAILRRSDAGWRLAHKALDGCFVSAVTVSEDGTLFAATHGVGVARSRDQGKTWTWINQGLDRHDLWSARAGRLQGKDVVLVGSLPAHLYISENAGDSLAGASKRSDKSQASMAGVFPRLLASVTSKTS